MYEDFVPERLAKLRTQKGVSARDMSLSLGQANNYLNNIENKKSLPAMQSFFYYCEYLGVTPQEFFDMRGTPTPKPYGNLSRRQSGSIPNPCSTSSAL